MSERLLELHLDRGHDPEAPARCDTLYLTSFYGGVDGVCIQLTLGAGIYVQLNADEIRRLWVELGNWLYLGQHRGEVMNGRR